MFENVARITSRDLTQGLGNGTTVITANRRLSRELHDNFRHSQIHSGVLAWETPDILPFESWLARMWKKWSVFDNGGSGSWTILNKLQSRDVWRQVVSRDISTHDLHSEPLWNVDATVKTAMHAWQLLNQWKIDPEACSASLLEDHRRFSRWTSQYSATCLENHWIDLFQLADRLVRILEQLPTQPGHTLVMAGFHEFSPQQQHLLARLQEHGFALCLYETGNSTPAAPSFCEYQDEYSQWLSAAHWAKQRLNSNPGARLALVVPNLSRSRNLIDYAFSQVLCPSRLTALDVVHSPPFHISLGPELAQYPIIKSAMRLLSLLSGNLISSAQVRVLILDPFIRGAARERNPRAVLEQKCRQRLPFEMNPQKLDSYLLDNPALPETPLLSTIIQSLGGQQERAAARKSFAGWADLFAQWLEICGWPGDESLDSVQHQVIDVFRDEITRLRTLDIVCDAVKLDTALARLHNRLGEQPFQVESTTSSIEILGVSECSGLEFDAIWFAGMNENDWPPPLDRSPFLPLNLQKESGYHGADLEKNLAYAAMLQNRLYHQANEILFSRTCFEKDVALYPGPLFQEPEQTPSPPRSLIRELQDYAPEMEIYQDHHGNPLVTGNPKGGARLIEDQAACPFRAYARHRLGADDREPRDQGLDPADRGRLVHSILESLWKQVQTSKNLAALSELELGRLLDQCISKQSRKFYGTSGVKSGFFDAQSSWLKKLLLEWFAIEQQRQLGFTVVASELPVTLNLEEIVLTLKIDRIDELVDGSLALIDYKTGDAKPVSNWIGERPGYPQLALYALSLYDNAEQLESRSLSALLVAQLKFGNCNHTGFVLGDDFYCESFPGKKVPGLDKTRINAELKSWPQIHSHWQSTLSGLARQFRQGEARVDPVDENACRNCNLHTLCRVSGQQRQQLDAL